MTETPVIMRVRELAKSGKLEDHLPELTQNRLPWSEWLSVTSFFAWVGGGIAISFFALEERPPGVDADFDHPSIYAAVLLIPFGALCWALSHVTGSRAERRRRKLGRKGQLMPAAIVQANNLWYREGNEDPFPASIVFTNDPAAREDASRIREVGFAVAELKGADRRALPADQAPLAWDLYHEMGPMRTKPIPTSLCNGLTDCWLATVTLPARPIEHEETVVALALPGDDAPDAVVVLPESVLIG